MPTQEDFTLRGMGAVRSAVLATGTISPPCRGVFVNVAGTITGKLEQDLADGDYIVAAGSMYGLCFKSIASLGTATGRLLY